MTVGRVLVVFGSVVLILCLIWSALGYWWLIPFALLTATCLFVILDDGAWSA